MEMYCLNRMGTSIAVYYCSSSNNDWKDCWMDRKGKTVGWIDSQKVVMQEKLGLMPEMARDCGTWMQQGMSVMMTDSDCTLHLHLYTVLSSNQCLLHWPVYWLVLVGGCHQCNPTTACTHIISERNMLEQLTKILMISLFCWHTVWQALEL